MPQYVPYCLSIQSYEVLIVHLYISRASTYLPDMPQYVPYCPSIQSYEVLIVHLDI